MSTFFGKEYIVKVTDDGECIEQGELIRCGECKYCSEKKSKSVKKHCNWWYRSVDDEYYCSMAKRKKA